MTYTSELYLLSLQTGLGLTFDFHQFEVEVASRFLLPFAAQKGKEKMVGALPEAAVAALNADETGTDSNPGSVISHRKSPYGLDFILSLGCKI